VESFKRQRRDAVYRSSSCKLVLIVAPRRVVQEVADLLLINRDHGLVILDPTLQPPRHLLQPLPRLRIQIKRFDVVYVSRQKPKILMIVRRTYDRLVVGKRSDRMNFMVVAIAHRVIAHVAKKGVDTLSKLSRHQQHISA
jgi:hypothetical protein